MNLKQLSVNQITAGTTNTGDLLAACADNGIRQVSLWRDRYIGNSAVATAKQVRAHGLTVSSLCRGGFFTGKPTRGISDNNLRAVDEAVALEAGSLVLVCGPIDAAGPAAAWDRIVQGVSDLVPVARAAGVTLAVEPFHPMLAAERSAIITLNQATTLLEAIADSTVKIAIDIYHLWWDPDLESALDRALPDAAVIQLADWLVPTTSLTAGRGLPGDGIIDIAAFLRRIDNAGYDGPVEIEVLNADVWQTPVQELIADVRRRFEGYLAALGARAAAGVNQTTVTGRLQPDRSVQGDPAHPAQAELSAASRAPSTTPKREAPPRTLPPLQTDRKAQP